MKNCKEHHGFESGKCKAHQTFLTTSKVDAVKPNDKHMINRPA